MMTKNDGDTEKTVTASTVSKDATTPAGSAECSDLSSPNIHTANFPIVGMGASAGGLEAFEEFFQSMPADSGMAFVIVVHLSPDHVSLLPELLQKKTSMPVVHVTENLKVEPNRVYVVPPNRELAILNGRLQLLQRTSTPRNLLPIDQFLRSLATDQADNAICVILSGTGTDGTLGLLAIKDKGGMALVQEPASARYDGMPQSAIATEQADYVLAPASMPKQLLSYVQHKGQQATLRLSAQDRGILTTLQKIYVLLRAQTGHDFSFYKKNTICRRIERRLHLHQLDSIEEYLRYLQESEHERMVLYKELLIGVTHFSGTLKLSSCWAANTCLNYCLTSRLRQPSVPGFPAAAVEKKPTHWP